MEDYDLRYFPNDSFILFDDICDYYEVHDFAYSLIQAKSMCKIKKNLKYKSCFEIFMYAIEIVYYYHGLDHRYIISLAEMANNLKYKSNNFCIFTLEKINSNTQITFVNSDNKHRLLLELHHLRLTGYKYINLTNDEDINKFVENNNFFKDNDNKKLYIVYLEYFMELLLNSTKI